ncbi:hypothetical protein RC77_02300 [Pectobacterium brasiliense]|nr:hypothetical protein RC77_02300 [Pectobacterium brasiliense]
MTMTNQPQKIDPRTPEGRQALRLMTVKTSALVSKLGLTPKHDRADYYSKGALCLMAVSAGLSPKDFF